MCEYQKNVAKIFYLGQTKNSKKKKKKKSESVGGYILSTAVGEFGVI